MFRRQRRHVLIVTLGLILGASHAGFAGPPTKGEIVADAFEPRPPGEIGPAGWLSGWLDEFRPDVKHGGWIGLDGLVHLVNDDALLAKAKWFVGYILEHQQPGGRIGRTGDAAGHQPYDPRPLLPLSKAVLRREDATADARLIPALLRRAREEVHPTTHRNDALEVDPDDVEESIELEHNSLNPTGSPFSAAAAPVSMRIKGRRVEAWKRDRGAAAPPPRSPTRGDAPVEELKMIPYGCTDLRITEFPTRLHSDGR